MRLMKWESRPGSFRLAVTVLAALLAGFAMTGCLAPTQGPVSVYARSTGGGDFSSIELTFTRVEVQRAGADIGDGQDATVDRGAGEEPLPGQSGLTLITGDPVGVDLLGFQEPQSRAFLGDKRATGGDYSLIILRFAEDVRGTLGGGGGEVSFQVPTREVRHMHDFVVEPAHTTRLILEFDLDASITEQDGSYRFDPVIANVEVQPRAPGGEADVPDRV